MKSTDTDELQSVAEPAVIKRRRYFSVVWLVPLIAAGVAAYLVYERVQRAGPLVTIRFQDGTGLKPGQSVVKYRGVNVGEVRSIALSSDLESVLVEVRFAKSAAGLAREGAVFWIVRPEVGMQSITGLGTLISGSYIEVLPGSGPEKKQFEGAASAPLKRSEEGLTIVLLSATRGSLNAGSPVYYRGMEVGAVQEYRLSPDARTVEFEVFIQKHFAPLVHSESQFWNASGVDVDFSLFKGAKVNVESLKSLVSGGIAFATPDTKRAGKSVENGAVFRLQNEPKKEWLEWSPAIDLPAKTAPTH
jgi:paraquat-inducible protein B